MHLLHNLRRDAALVAGEALGAREPALIDLPIPLPTIPILAPVVTLLVGGSTPKPTTQAAPTTAAATTAPAPAPATTTAPSGNGGGSGGSGNGSGGSGTTTVDGGGQAATTTVQGTTSIIGQPGASGGSTGGSASSTDSPLPSGVATEVGGNPVANAAVVPTNVSGAGGDFSVSSVGSGNGLGGSGSASPTAGLTGSGSSSSTGSGDGTGTGGENTSGSGSPGTGSGGISTGAIAAIVVILLLSLIGVLILFLRKRARARQTHQANRWWFSRKRTSQTYGDAQRPPSACSSFATTFDRSGSASRHQSKEIPPLPSMTEANRALMEDGPLSGMDQRFSTAVSWNTARNSDLWDSPDSPALPSVRSRDAESVTLYATPTNSVVDIPSSYFRISTIAAPPLPPIPTSPPPTPRLLTNPFADDNPFDDPSPAA